MQVLYAKNVLEVEALYCGSVESLVKCAALDTKCQKGCKDISSWSRIGEEVKMSGHYVQLCPNPLRFEPVTKENSVFFDEANRQVWRWAHMHTYTFHSWNLQEDLWERFPYNLIHLSIHAYIFRLYLYQLFVWNSMKLLDAYIYNKCMGLHGSRFVIKITVSGLFCDFRWGKNSCSCERSWCQISRHFQVCCRCY